MKQEGKTLIAPSILAADWGKFAEEIKAVQRAGADWIHIDVMDGHFVPPITFGAQIVEAARKVTNLPLDVHLMIERPDLQLENFARAGADSITVHAEACQHLHRTLQAIRALGKKAGVALNPATPVSVVAQVLDDIDLLLIMTVNPGWGGQKYIAHSDQKIREARQLLGTRKIQLEVDGGINHQTAPRALSAGADILVAGTSVFREPDYRAAISNLRS